MAASKTKRSEILFDVLRATDSNAEHTDSNTEQSVLPAVSQSNDLKSDGKVMKDKIISKDKSQAIENTDEKDKILVNDILKYNFLLNEIDSNISIAELCSSLQYEKDLGKRCQSALNLAVFCRSQLKEEESKCIFNALDIVWDENPFYALSFCEALLFHMLSRQNLTPERFVILEKNILRVASSVIAKDSAYGGVGPAKMILIGGERYLTAVKLCKEIFSGENLDFHSLNVSTVCCSSLKNLSKLKNLTICTNKFTDRTLQYILTMIGTSTQDIVSEDIGSEDGEEILEKNISVSSYIVYQCLQVLEQILSADPSSPCKTLDHKDYSLLRCLTKLLEWSMASLFTLEKTEKCQIEAQSASHALHHSTLVLILKVFSILSYDPDQYEYFTNIKGSMETIMICILKAYFHCKKTHFDILVLALELMINFSFKCSKTFAILCLKKFHLNNSQEVLGIEALLKILDSSLQKINEVKSRPTKKVTSQSQQVAQSNGATQPECEDSSSEDHDVNLVLQAAGEDMELSTIISFVSILIMLFIDIRKTFLDYVRERMSRERSAEVVAVLKKFLEFAVMTGGMPATGILLLRTAIKKINELYSDT